jgi:hypothetical protein
LNFNSEAISRPQFIDFLPYLLVFASMAGYVITLSGVFWCMLFFDEIHSTWVWSSLALMLAGMALVTPCEQSEK